MVVAKLQQLLQNLDLTWKFSPRILTLKQNHNNYDTISIKDTLKYQTDSTKAIRSRSNYIHNDEIRNSALCVKNQRKPEPLQGPYLMARKQNCTS